MSLACENPGCDKPGTNVCTACRETRYCSRECQKAHWSDHKRKCTGKLGNLPPVVKEVTASAPEGDDGGRFITDGMKAAGDRGAVHLPEGTFNIGTLTLETDGLGITLVGAPGKKTVLKGTIDIEGGMIALKDLVVEGGGVKASKQYAVPYLRDVEIRNAETGIHILKEAVVNVQRCHIHHCEDGIICGRGTLAAVSTLIEDCECDGIFSNPDFVISNSTIRNVGRHGIKSRGGVTRVGKNDIQPSPWDGFGGYGIF
jgi:MYND finger/Right handed beta helix region